MFYVIIYISSVITVLSLIGFIYQLSQLNVKNSVINSLTSKVVGLNNQITLLVEKVNKHKLSAESDKRLATLEWSGWHNINDPKITWSVTFELREIALSEDESRSKFEVISTVSENIKNETWGTQEYTDYFIKRTGGGWLDTKKIPFSKMKLTWITTVSKSEARQKKIDEILKPDNNE